MNNIKFLFFVTFFLNLLTSAYSQKIIAFDKRGKVKRVKYYEGEFIRLKTHDKQLIRGVITRINDSSFFVESKQVQLNAVSKVFNTQKLYGINLMGNVFFIAGSGYVTLDSFNRLINNDNPVFNEQSAKVSGYLLGAGLVCYLIANRGYKISKKRPLKIIDLTI